MKKEKIINIGKVEYRQLEHLNQINMDHLVIITNMVVPVVILGEAHLKINMEVPHLHQLIRKIKKMLTLEIITLMFTSLFPVI